ncbi:FliH/SctL family protein [Sphingomonas sp.]|uniref:FliH/SctL family protein n=1 Tax=Sphingomonas sp. TaxID=28214 RepID=UPI002D197273|nr:FliH/SctL family protein [Sphingomonas sp.]HWK36609.1 FliH/SctL family protein [Sphingomonas sp.]
MSDFRAGFASRHDAAAAILSAAFALPAGFEAIDPRERIAGVRRPKSFKPQPEQANGPRHFTPLDPDSDPTEGWDPLDPESGLTGDDRTADAGGFIDPIAAAREAGNAEGFAAGLAHAAAEAGRDRALIDAIGEALGKGERFDRERIARDLRQTVLLLVSRMVGEAGVSADLLASRVEAAVDMLADAAESMLLRLNPADVALVDGRLPGTLFPVADPAIARGSFVLESASTIVEDGPGQWLEQLSGAIDRAAMPK